MKSWVLGRTPEPRSARLGRGRAQAALQRLASPGRLPGSHREVLGGAEALFNPWNSYNFKKLLRFYYDFPRTLPGKLDFLGPPRTS